MTNRTQASPQEEKLKGLVKGVFGDDVQINIATGRCDISGERKTPYLLVFRQTVEGIAVTITSKDPKIYGGDLIVRIHAGFSTSKYNSMAEELAKRYKKETGKDATVY